MSKFNASMPNYFREKIICLSACLLISVLKQGFAVPRSEGGDHIVLEHADTLRTKGGYRQLIGHVRIRRGVMVITSERARHDPNSGQVILTGNVMMEEPGRTIKAKHVSYNELTGNFEAREDVDMTQADSIRIRCKIARYDKETSTVDLFDDVIIDNLSDMARITGDHGRWYELENSGLIDQNPVYRLPDKEGSPPDTLVIVSERLAFDRETSSALFTENVKLVQTELWATADSLHHLPDSNRTILAGDPVIHQGKDELFGNWIELRSEGRQLSNMHVLGEAMAVSIPEEDSLLYNIMTGEKLKMTTLNDSSRLVRVEGDAQGIYHVWDEDGVYHGVNQSVADVIELTIVANKTTSIRLEGRANGVFYPPEYIPDDLRTGETILHSRKKQGSP